MEKPHIHLHESASAINDALADKNETKAFTIYNDQTDAALKALIDKFVSYQKLITEESEALQLKASTSTTRMLIILIIIGIASAAFTIIFSLLFTRSLTKPINSLLSFIQNISTGDLTQNIVVDTKDEIATMANALDNMQKKLREITQSISESIEQVAASSEELSGTAENLSENAQNQASVVEETSASIEELSASVENISTATEEQKETVENTTVTMKMLADSINTVAGLAEQVRDGANTSVGQADNAVNEAHKAINGMKLIEESSKQMSEIVSVIRDIADNTSLLALNASIEAARAGDAGRGFAVVADSVSKLAERSATSSKEIEQLIIESNQRVHEGSSIVE